MVNTNTADTFNDYYQDIINILLGRRLASP